MLDRSAEIQQVLAYGIDLRNGDYHRDLTQDQACFLAESAKSCGYRKPRNANGSTGRYFFEHLKKQHLATFK